MSNRGMQQANQQQREHGVALVSRVMSFYVCVMYGYGEWSYRSRGSSGCRRPWPCRSSTPASRHPPTIGTEAARAITE